MLQLTNNADDARTFSVVRESEPAWAHDDIFWVDTPEPITLPFCCMIYRQDAGKTHESTKCKSTSHGSPLIRWGTL